MMNRAINPGTFSPLPPENKKDVTVEAMDITHEQSVAFTK